MYAARKPFLWIPVSTWQNRMFSCIDSVESIFKGKCNISGSPWNHQAGKFILDRSSAVHKHRDNQHTPKHRSIFFFFWKSPPLFFFFFVIYLSVYGRSAQTTAELRMGLEEVGKGAKIVTAIQFAFGYVFLFFWLFRRISNSKSSSRVKGGGADSCHGRPGCYRDRISRLCLGDTILSAALSPSVHRRPSLHVSWLADDHDKCL